MERLTNRSNRDGISIQRMFDRLAAYEDTGLGPEEIEVLQAHVDGLTELFVNTSCGGAVSYTRLAELAQAEKDGRLVVLPEGTESMMMAGFVAKGNEMLYPVMETKGNPDFIPAMLSLMIKSVSVANGISYDMFLSALIDNPPVTTCKQDTGRKAEAALKKREEGTK